MGPLPIRCRALRALELSPLTIDQLAICLSADPHYIQRVVRDLTILGAVEQSGQNKPVSRKPSKVWRIAA